MSDDDLFYVKGIWYYLCFVFFDPYHKINPVKMK